MTEGAARKCRILWSKEPAVDPDYSDWKITLTKNEIESPSAVTFAVHRHMVGPQSTYFTKIMRAILRAIIVRVMKVCSSLMRWIVN